MFSDAVVLNAPHDLALRRLAMAEPGPGDLVIDVRWSGISTGTERLLYTGRMPAFPGMGYPLVPGYESVGTVRLVGEQVGEQSGGIAAGQTVFIPGSTCLQEVRSLFGATASTLVVPATRVVPVPETLGASGILLALAATAQHAIAPGSDLPELIVGHGVLGRLIARLVVLQGGTPVVWEHNDARSGGALGYQVVRPADDSRRDYRVIVDASGDPALLDTLVARLAPGGEIVLAGFYADRLSFAFPPAFMREARFRVAAQWHKPDLDAVTAYAASGALDLSGLLTHAAPASDAPSAYRTAFEDPSCLKMALDWSVA